MMFLGEHDTEQLGGIVWAALSTYYYIQSNKAHNESSSVVCGVFRCTAGSAGCSLLKCEH